MQRGLQYAASGRVTRCEWDPAGLAAVGEVAGTSAVPYQVSVHLTRRADSTLGGVDARCTCPVGINCKHAVALLLAPEPASPGAAARAAAAARGRQSIQAPATPPPRPDGHPDLHLLRMPEEVAALPAARTADALATARAALAAVSLRHQPPVPEWDEPLRALLGDAGTDAGVLAAEPGAGGAPGLVGLQFDLVPSRQQRGHRYAVGRPGIRLRPVVRSQAGNWVRTGMSWSRLEHHGYGAALGRSDGAHTDLLREMRALHHTSGSPFWSMSGDEVVWLESINSRRLWDLLRHAGEVGMPLLRAGRVGGVVDLRATPADAALDLTAADAGLVLRPQVTAGGARLDTRRTLLIGVPAHGLAWWEGRPDANRTPELHLAPLSQPLSAAAVEVFRGEPLAIPADGVERFRRDLYPQLRRRIRMVCSDGSLELPDPSPDTVCLTVACADGPVLELAWALVGGGGSARPLSAGPDRAAAATIAAILQHVGADQDLVQATPVGPRIAPVARLTGLAAARWATSLLPTIEGIDGVTVVRAGDIPDFREVPDAPVVRLGGDESPTGDWFDLSVEVSVGGEDVAFAALFTALAGGDSHLLLPSGAYFALDRPELRRLAALIAEARALDDGRGRTIRLSRFQASLWDELQELGAVDAARAGAWADAVAALSGLAAEADRPLPEGLRATLRPYQAAGYQWLASRYAHGLGGILADDMGLGKTLAALALICHGRETAHLDGPWLVVAPTSVVGNWVSEAARFCPGLPVVAVTETSRRRGVPLAAAVAGAGMVVTSYALFRLDYDEYEALPWAGLVLDEAQFAKNPASHNNQRARRLPVRFKLAMTGTPLENSLAELWALTAIVAPGLFAGAERFAETYRTPIERQGDGERLDQLRRRVRPVMLRRTKEQVAPDLPDKQEQVLELDLHPRHERLYQTYLQRERQKVLGLLGDLDGNRFEIFRSLTLLRQAALDVSLVDPDNADVPSTKLDALAEMLGDIVADGHRVLVFSQFTRFLTTARRRVEGAGIATCYLDGTTTKRPEVIERFRTGDAPVFLISLKAGGFGLNLTEADYCILLDPWWNPATEAQAVDRVHRIGQTRKVMVYRLVARGTIEEKVMALKARKAALFDSVLGGGGFESGALTAADVRALLG